MKQLKIEVGKTYRSRKGDKVRIVDKDDAPFGPYPYRSEDGYSYQENGRFWHTEWADDLIEEVPETTRRTFAIPDGVKKVTVEQVGNRIVVEIVPEAPKPGDVMKNKHGSVYIFKEVRGESHEYFACLGRDGRVYYHSVAIPGRPATPEEAQPLFDALKEAGKRWNPETMEVEDVPKFDLILEWVEANIKDGYYNHEDVAEAIEGYLKHKEGEK